ncbi:BMP family ABC transporter substrate-binding protein [Micrococcus sp.]|uniref:BMP family lipoprotein n=1 Tax=Micrococcus sp. TaxID=1271 RepID=UPI002A9170FD|nr:BMP family ABC transporter substrate-binding protein [Micrococcus sp.]MDY6054484.1 BMP family ABC transporter substrate-binding protein [Micrococcus sp.]
MGITAPSARRSLLIPAALLSSSLLLAGCGAPPEESAAPTSTGAAISVDPAAGSENSDHKVCIVSDAGGFDDRSFNESSYTGLMAAKEAYGIQTGQMESQDTSQYTPNVNAQVQAGCNSVIVAGYLMDKAIKPIAAAHPEVNFYAVDITEGTFTDNVKLLTYDTTQAAFLAGYAAASATETGAVATYGGMAIPTVMIFMDGFAAGVEHYNEVKGENVKVLGWDRKAKTGSFTGDFENQANGKTNTTNLINEGADIVMPVAGTVGLGTLDAVKEANAAGKDVKVVWVDTDGYESTDAGDVILTSVMKNMGQSVSDVIGQELQDKFSPEPYVGTLENGGVELAPFHAFDDKVSQETKDELKKLEEQIISGELTIDSEYSLTR